MPYLHTKEHTLIPHCAHKAADRLTQMCAHVHMLLGQTRGEIIIQLQNADQKCHNIFHSALFLTVVLQCSLFRIFSLFFFNFLPLFIHLHMNINSLYQCSFWAINLICAFHPRCSDVRWQTFVSQCCGKRQHIYASKGLYLEKRGGGGGEGRKVEVVVQEGGEQ